MTEEKLYFVPLVKRRIIANEKEPTVTIGRNKVLIFSQLARISLIKDFEYMKMFIDQERRTIGFKLLSKAPLSDFKDVKKIFKNKDGRQVSFGQVIKLFGVEGQLFSKLPIKEYEDTFYGKLFIFKIPKKGQIKEKIINNNLENDGKKDTDGTSEIV